MVHTEIERDGDISDVFRKNLKSYSLHLVFFQILFFEKLYSDLPLVYNKIWKYLSTILNDLIPFM